MFGFFGVWDPYDGLSSNDWGSADGLVRYDLLS